MKYPLCLVAIFIVFGYIECKSIIMANYHNVILFFPKELGGNDDLRVIFDVRNVTEGTFKYMPVIVSVAYDSLLNQAYCYMESAITSYIMLLKWSGGSWCYQVIFEFPASQFSKFMYHSIILTDNFIYWTTDRFVMSGRLPGYEKRLLLQPSWNRVYSMTADKSTDTLYVAGFDYTENALFKCNLRGFTCIKLVTTDFTINYIQFNRFTHELYATSMQGKYLYKYVEDFSNLVPLETVQEEVSNIIFLEEDYAVYSNQQSIKISVNINFPNSTRRAQAKLVDPYALQYIFSFNQITNFDSYPYPYYFSDYHDLLYRNSLYLFYFYICGMDYVENDYVFLPQMDLNNQFLRIENCRNRYFNDRQAYLIPAVIGGVVGLILIIAAILVCLWRSKMCSPRVTRIKMRLKRCCFDYCKCCIGPKRPDTKEKKNIFSQNKTKRDSTKNKISANSVSFIDNLRKEMVSSSADSSGISSLPSMTEHILKRNNLLTQTEHYPKSSQITDENTEKTGISGSMGGQFRSQDSESYDNDPINLTDVDYSKYAKRSKIKKPPKTYSSGIYIIRKNNTGDFSQATDTSNTTAASTPTISSVSQTSSIDSEFTEPSSSRSSTFSTMNNNRDQNNRVKFNEFQIQHHYDQYDEYPTHSRIYDYQYTTKPNSNHFMSSPNNVSNDYYTKYSDLLNSTNQITLTNPLSVSMSSPSSASSSSVHNSSLENEMVKSPLEQLNKKLGKYYRKEYISNCNIPLYGAAYFKNNEYDFRKSIEEDDELSQNESEGVDRI